MIRLIGMDTPTNILDDLYDATKRKVQDVVTNSYDDIDNVIPNDVIDIDFSKENDNKKTTTQPNFINRNIEKIKNFFVSKK